MVIIDKSSPAFSALLAEARRTAPAWREIFREAERLSKPELQLLRETAEKFMAMVEAEGKATPDDVST